MKLKDVPMKCLGKNGACKKPPMVGASYCWWHASRAIKGTKWYWNGATLGIGLAIASLCIGYYWYKNSASSDQAEQIKEQGTNTHKKLDEFSDDLADVKALMTAHAYEVEAAIRPKLLEKYPYGYAVFSAGGTFFSQELMRGEWNPLRVQMGLAKTLAITNDRIQVRTPGIIYNPSTNILLDLGSLATTLQRTNGAWSSLGRFSVGVNTNLNLTTNHHIAIEVIANHQDGVTLLVGVRESVVPTPPPRERSRLGKSPAEPRGATPP